MARLVSISADYRLRGFNKTTVSLALNSPGQPVWNFRERAMVSCLVACIAAAPVGNPLNATHRGGRVGGFKAGMGADRKGSNQYQLRFNITNSAAHARFVEVGRNRSRREEYFGWVDHNPPGSAQWHLEGTEGRPGTHVIENTVKATMRLLTL